MKLWKCTNDDECHNGLQYHDGLIIDPLPWNPHGSCSPGGIYYADDEHILKFLGAHSWVREVTIPDDAKVYAEDSKFKADRVILGKRIAIHDFLTQYIVDHNGIIGDVDVHGNFDAPALTTAGNVHVYDNFYAPALTTAGNVDVYGNFDAPALTTAGNVDVHVHGKFDAPKLHRPVRQ